jgi:hypothetical protein
VHWKFYGKSDKVNAVGNRNKEFQDGYRTGVESFDYDVNTTIEEEYFIRLEVRDDIRSGFEEWKRGYWAAYNSVDHVPWKESKKRNAKR